jgi:DNA-binding response OmpR family regulator
MGMGEAGARSLVLVVDDDRDHLLMLETLLDAVGYDVMTAASCAAGRALLQEHAIDALIADYSLGDGTAFDLIKDIGAHRPRVALVLSGFDSSDDIERTLQAGYDAHLVKPTAIELLREALADGLRRPSGIRLAHGSSVPPEPSLESAPRTKRSGR